MQPMNNQSDFILVSLRELVTGCNNLPTQRTNVHQ